MRIEILYFGGCHGAPEALDAVRRVVAEAKLDADVIPIGVVTEVPPGFSGSPTVLVDGEDPLPAEHVDALSCRLYEMPEGIENAPTDAMLRTASEARTEA